jgi:hypothetical protein
MADIPLASFLSIGIVPTLLPSSAWAPSQLEMQAEAAEHSWAEVERAFRQFLAGAESPEVVMIPELSVPRSKVSALRRLAGALGCVVLAGVDFHATGGRAMNRACLLIPWTWPDRRPSQSSKLVWIGKAYPAETERKHLADQQPPLVFQPEPNLWIFDAGVLGRFGVCLCFDFMDVDRPPLYRGQIHHLFVLAHNKDVGSFAHVAESLARTIYCNVIVCNTGWFGGSIAITPYYDHSKRPVFQLLGRELSSTQVIKVPVRAIDRAIREGILTADGERVLKGLPPGFGPLP